MLAGSNSVIQPGEDLSQAEKKALQGRSFVRGSSGTTNSLGF